MQIENKVKLFAEQYYEKIFYFSLKKTGNQTEAEDLTSEVALDIITALRKGFIPEHFSAFVWKCARSRFCKWTEKKYNHRKYFDDSVGDSDVLDNLESSPDLENDYILKEDINVLRREIALISKDYREILVSFYIDDKKVSQIAKEFNLPEGTVKTKLFKSRKILTEGMKMAREFGVKSYKPENVNFVMSGSQSSDGAPWSKIKTKLAKNILLETYYNPSTIEGLSLELGVAAPYMEEAVDELVNAELLKELSNGKEKYETNFIILNAETQRDIENANLKIKDEYFTLAKEILDIIEKDGKKDLLGGTQTFEELKWLYLLNLTDVITSEVNAMKFPNNSWDYSKRLNNGTWDLLGFEEYTKGEYNGFIGNNGNSYDFKKIEVRAYDFQCYNWGERKTNYSFNPEQVKVIEKILDGKIGEADKNIVEELINLGAFEVKDGKYICKIAVCQGKDILKQSVSEDVYKNKITPVLDKLISLNSKMFDEIIGIVKKAIPERLQDKTWFALETENTRTYIFNTAIKAGYITIPKDFNKSMVGIAVYKK